MTNIRYLDGNSNRLHSDRFWRKDIINAIRIGQRDGFYHFDDFSAGGSAQATNDFTWYGGSACLLYRGYATASSTIKCSRSASDDQIGVLEVDTTAVDNDEAYVTLDNTYGEPLVKASNAAGDNFPFWFETRVRFTDVSSNAGKFVGLWQGTNPTTGDMANATGAPGDFSYLGFRTLVADPNGMDAVHRNGGGGGEVVVAEAADYSRLDISASTWAKYGLFYDGTKLHYYMNGVEIGTGVLPSATDFPNADPLNPRWGIRSEATISGFKMEIDWVAIMRLDELRI